MNILFVLYGDLSRNTAGPISLFARHLKILGHECTIAVPDHAEFSYAHKNESYSVALFSEILEKKGLIFSNNKRADIVHACTPRISVYQFVCQYMNIVPTPIAIYLEDNENWISKKALNACEESLLELSNKNILDNISTDISHPFEYKNFIGLCDLAILIQKKLATTVPFFVPHLTVPWGVDLTFFKSNPENIFLQKKILNISPKVKVIVYHGGINDFTKPAIQDLCNAVLKINELGEECILVKTGPGKIASISSNNQFPQSHFRDLGNVARDELPKILNIADIFVQPGRINAFEDLRLPSKLPEFLAMGKPTVLPNCNIADIFHDGEDALLLQSGDPDEIAQCCLRVFQDPTLSKKLGIGARFKAETFFDIEKQTKNLLSAYKDTISQFDFNSSKTIWEKAIQNGTQYALNSRLEILISRMPSLGREILSFALEQNNCDQKRIVALGNRIDSFIKHTARIEEEMTKLQSMTNLQDRNLKSLNAAVEALHNSRSWKITLPLRWLSDLHRKIKQS